MTPKEINAARHQLGLSQAGLARVMGIADDRTIRRWESGETPITGPASLLLRYMVRYGLPDVAL